MQASVGVMLVDAGSNLLQQVFAFLQNSVRKIIRTYFPFSSPLKWKHKYDKCYD